MAFESGNMEIIRMLYNKTEGLTSGNIESILTVCVLRNIFKASKNKFQIIKWLVGNGIIDFSDDEVKGRALYFMSRPGAHIYGFGDDDKGVYFPIVDSETTNKIARELPKVLRYSSIKLQENFAYDMNNEIRWAPLEPYLPIHEYIIKKATLERGKGNFKK